MQSGSQGVYIDKNQFFARLAVDANTIFDVYPEFVLSKQRTGRLSKKKEILVSLVLILRKNIILKSAML